MIQNQGVEPVSFQLALEIGSDFADIFTVKSYDFAFGDPLHAPPLPPLAEPTFDAEAGQFLLADPASSAATQVILSEPPSLVEGAWASYAIELAPRERWELVVDVVPSPTGDVVHRNTAERRFGEELQHVRDSLTAWQLRVPQLRPTGTTSSARWRSRSRTSRRCAYARRRTGASTWVVSRRQACRGS